MEIVKRIRSSIVKRCLRLASTYFEGGYQPRRDWQEERGGVWLEINTKRTLVVYTSQNDHII